MASTASVIEIQSFINDRRIGGFQILVVALCALTVFLDGFDTQSVAFVAPSIAIEWHLPRAALAPIFSASLVGLLVGALLFGPVADKLGRRAVIMLSTAIFGACTLLTATSADVTRAPHLPPDHGARLGRRDAERHRAHRGVLSGAAARDFGDDHVHRLLARRRLRRRACRLAHPRLRLALGVVRRRRRAAAASMPLQFVALPKSIRFLVVKEAARARIAALVQRIDRRFAVPAEARFEIAEARAPGVPVAHLFRGNRTSGTLLLWIMFFCNLLDVFFLQNWIPTIANSAGIPVQTAVVIGTLFQVGGVVAALLIGFAIDRYSAYPVLGCSTLWASCSSSPSARPEARCRRSC